MSPYWILYFEPTMLKLCRRKFNRFGNDAQFRSGEYTVVFSKIEIGANVVNRSGGFIF